MNILRRSFVLLTLSLAVVSFIGCGGPAKPKIDVQAQISELSSPDAEKRQNACIALGEAGEGAAPAVPALIPLLKDKDPLVRRLAAYALGMIGPKAKAAVPALKEATGDRDSSVVETSINALREIDPKSGETLKAPPHVTQ